MSVEKDFEPITTQEDFDNRIKERLERERHKFDGFMSVEEVEKMKTEYENRIAQFDGALSKDKAEELSQSIADLQARSETLGAENAELKNTIIRRDLAEEYHLPSKLANRIKGDTEESMREDAESLSQLIKSVAQPLPLASTEEVSSADTVETGLKHLLKNINEERK